MRVLLGLLVVCSAVMAQALDTPFLVGDESNHRVALYDADLKLVWDYPILKPYSAHLLPNGNILTPTGSGVVEISPEKKVVWSFSRGKNEIFGAARIGDLTVVGDCTGGEILFVDADGAVQKKFKAVFKVTGHGNMRTLTVTPQNTLLVAHFANCAVREYDLDGKVLQQFPVRSHVYQARRLENGHTLVSHEKGLTEFDDAGKVLSDVKPADIPSVGLAFGTSVRRLPNGNTVMANWFGHGGKGKSLFELNLEMEVVWLMPEGVLGSVVAFEPMTESVMERYKNATYENPPALVIPEHKKAAPKNRKKKAKSN
jgi:hypothetical protein